MNLTTNTIHINPRILNMRVHKPKKEKKENTMKRKIAFQLGQYFEALLTNSSQRAHEILTRSSDDN